MKYFLSFLTILLFLFSCSNGEELKTQIESEETTPEVYKINYNANGAEEGMAPVDDSKYSEGEKVEILGNNGDLSKNCCVFAGWNTETNGSGKSYKEGDKIIMGNADVDLFANWSFLYRITYLPNGADTGDVPIDTSSYPNGDEVVLLGNVGELGKTGKIFTGWSTSLDDSGLLYSPGERITVKNEDITLYARWEILQLKTFSIGDSFAEIDPESGLVFIKVPYNTNLTSIVAVFTTNGDRVTIDGLEIESGKSSVDYSDDLNLSVYYTEKFSKDYVVRVFPTVGWTELDQMILNGENVSRLDVSLIEDMSRLFKDQTNFSQDLSLWDISNVIDMSYMLQDAEFFTSDITSWNVSKVKNMRGMFRSNATFNQNISSWNVESVEDMSYMFWNADAFNQNLNNWNVASVIEMKSMFKSTDSFNQDLNNWQLSSIEEISEIFYSASSFNKDVSAWSNYLLESVSHEDFSGGVCSLPTEYHPYDSWNE